MILQLRQEHPSARPWSWSSMSLTPSAKGALPEGPSANSGQSERAGNFTACLRSGAGSAEMPAHLSCPLPRPSALIDVAATMPTAEWSGLGAQRPRSPATTTDRGGSTAARGGPGQAGGRAGKSVFPKHQSRTARPGAGQNISNWGCPPESWGSVHHSDAGAGGPPREACPGVSAVLWGWGPRAALRGGVRE